MQSYINEINKIKSADYGNFDVLQIQEYANTLSDLEPKQSALLLSTQGLSNAQIQQTLAAQNLSTANQYQAMVESGLLQSKQKLTNVQLQEILQSQLGSKSKAQEVMTSLGLSAAIEGEEAQTIELTAKKLQLANASGLLSAAETQQLAMTTGVTIAQKAQVATTMPTWIAQIKAMTLATWEQVTATITWLATNPAGWAILAGGAIAGVIGLVDLFTTSIEESEEKIKSLTSKIDEQQQAIDELNTKEKEATDLYKQYASLMSKANAYGLTAEEKENLLDISNQLVNTYGLEIEGIDAITGAYIIGTDAINNYTEALRAEKLEKLKEQKGTRDTRITENLNIIENSKENLDTWKEAKDNRVFFTSILMRQKNFLESEEFKKLSNPEKEKWINYYNTEIENRAVKRGIDEEVVHRIIQDFDGELDIDGEISKIEAKLYSSTNSIIKDVIANIQVDSANYINQTGENVLTSMMQSILPNMEDLDEDKIEEIQDKAETFVSSYGYALDEIGSKNKQIQERLNSDTVGISDYIDLLENQQQQVDAVSEMLGANEAKILAEQFSNTNKNNTGILFAQISKSMKEADLNTTRFDNLTTSILQLDKAMTSGKITFSEYIEELDKSLKDVSLQDTFQNNEEYAKQFFSTLTTKGKSSIQNLATQMQNGEISQEDYLNGLNDIANYFTNLANKANSIPNIDKEILGNINQSSNDISNYIAQVEKSMDVIQNMPNTWEKFKEGGVNAINALTNSLKTAGITAEDLGYDAGTAIDEIVQDMYDGKAEFDSVQDALENKFKKTLYDMGVAVGKLINGLMEAFGSVSFTIKTPEGGFFKNIWDAFWGNSKETSITVGVKGGVGEDTMGNLFSNAFDGFDWGNENFGESSSGSSGTGNDDSSSKDTKESFNWIEIAISRAQRAVANFGKTVSATWKSWTDRNNAISSQMSAITNEISVQKDALAKYTALADHVTGLTPEEKQRVRKGAIRYDDENLSSEKSDAIKKYQEYYEAALAAEDALIDLENERYELIQTNFDNIAKQYDDQLSLIEHEANSLNTSIEMIEKQGHAVSEDYYHSLIQNANQQISVLQSKYSKLQSVMSGVAFGTEMWYSLNSQLLSIQEEMDTLTNSTIDWENAIRDLDWENFDQMLEKMSAVNSEADFLMGFMSGDDMFSEDGTITYAGQATMGLHAINRNSKMAQADKIARELQSLDAKYASDSENLTYLERRNELEQQYRDLILDAKDDEQALIDMQKDQYDALLDHMSNLIEKRKDMLSQAKDAYDYEKNIAEQTEEVAKLEKQLSAYQGDTSEESRATIQQLKVSLEDAKENLEETQYEKYISDQEQMLDSLYEETEEWINTRLDNEALLLENILAAINENAGSIRDALVSAAYGAGTTLSGGMNEYLASNHINSQAAGLSNQYAELFAQIQNASDQLQFSLPTLPAYTAGTPTSTGVNNITINGLSLEFPNVQTPDEWVTYLQHDKRFENIILEITDGNNSLSKYKW